MLTAARHIRKDLSALKFTPKREGPYVIYEAYDSGYLSLDPILEIPWQLSMLNDFNVIILDIFKTNFM